MKTSSKLAKLIAAVGISGALVLGFSGAASAADVSDTSNISYGVLPDGTKVTNVDGVNYRPDGTIYTNANGETGAPDGTHFTNAKGDTWTTCTRDGHPGILESNGFCSLG